MTAPDPHAGYDELAVGHALGALEPAEEDVFLRHLTGCTRCEHAVADSLETMSHLAYAAPSAAPPAALWDAIRAGVEESGREAAFPALPGEPPVRDDLAAARERRERRGPLVRRAAALTSVAAGFALVATLVTQNVAMREREQDQLAWTQGMEKVLSAYGSDARRVALVGQSASAGQVPVVAVVDGDRVHLVVDSLAPNDTESSTYVLWESSATGAVRAVGTFDVTGDHDIEVVDDLQLRDARRLEALLITKEPGRKAPAATAQQPVARGTVA